MAAEHTRMKETQAMIGLGRIVALHDHSSTLYQIR
jgi:hypothetical protein